MLSVSLDFSGLEAIGRDLELLSKAENNKVLRDATREGATVIAAAVKERAPSKTGDLKKSVVVLTQKGKRGRISSGVHIRGKRDKPAFYWRFIELGTVNIPAVPFVRPAFDEKEDAAARAAFARLNKAIDEVLQK